jgi:hypothetical protein
MLSHLPRSDHTRSVEAKQLDEGIVDTFVSVGVKNGAHTSVSISASDGTQIHRAAHLELLLDELVNLVSFKLRLAEPQLAGSDYSRDFDAAAVTTTSGVGPAFVRTPCSSLSQ